MTATTAGMIGAKGDISIIVVSRVVRMLPVKSQCEQQKQKKESDVNHKRGLFFLK
jgi:hypothetical protein